MPSPTPSPARVVLDPLTSTPTLVAPAVSRRPSDHGRVGVCNFCPGQEALAGIETHRVGSPWRARSWLNSFPLFGETAGVPGLHEVGVYSPVHLRTLGMLEPGDVAAAGDLLSARYAAHSEAGLAYTHLLVNHGPSSGGSVVHPHFQLYGLEVLPPLLTIELPNLSGSSCALCALAGSPPADLVVEETAETLTISPAWARKPLEMLVLPRSHAAPLPELLGAVSRAAAALEVDEGISYHVGGHAAPRGTGFHAHAHLTPYPQLACGFGAHTGMSVLKSDPVSSAELLRKRLSSRTGAV